MDFCELFRGGEPGGSTRHSQSLGMAFQLEIIVKIISLVYLLFTHLMGSIQVSPPTLRP